MRYIILAIGVLMSLTMFGQSSYYYYQGERIPLTIDSSKCATVASKNASIFAKETGTSVVSSKNVNIHISESREESRLSSKRENPSGVFVPENNSYPVYISQNGRTIIPDGYINIRLESEDQYALLKEVADRYNIEIVEQNAFMPLWYNLAVTEATPMPPVEMCNYLYETYGFSAVSPSFTGGSGYCFSYDPYIENQYNLYNIDNEYSDINVVEAWGYATGKGITVAVIDTGIDMSHEDLISNLLPISYDADSNSSPAKRYLPLNHGTYCAGILGAERNNDKGVAGVAPEVSILNISLDADDHTKPNFEQSAANAINWAWQNGADVLSCSWTCDESEIIVDAINNALRYGRNYRGCVIVFGSGNRNVSVEFPANCNSEVIAVGSVDKNGYRSGFSSYGWDLFICAPGELMTVCAPDNKYYSESEIGTAYPISGTSFSAPQVAGVAAMMLEKDPTLSIDDLKYYMAISAKRNPKIWFHSMQEYDVFSYDVGYGLLDAGATLRNVVRKKF